MRTLWLGVLSSLVAPAALGHIKLTNPQSATVTTSLGDPQKNEPCGPMAGQGTPTNAVTTVVAGSMLTVQWTETILHPGHFRLALAPDAGAFRTPTPVLNQGGANCASAPIEAQPAAPVLVDGLFPHTTARSGYTTTVRVPDTPCERCTLQLMQFMSAHAPPCFYYQCATLRIVAADAGQPDAGADGGVGGSDAGSSDAGPGDAGLPGADAGAPPDAGASPPDAGPGTPQPPVGCGCFGAEGWPLVVAVAALGRRRSRRRHR